MNRLPTPALLRRPGRALAAAVLGAATLGATANAADLREALESITERDLHAHLRFLSADELRGRAPGTFGGDAAAAYIATQFARAGLEPVADDFLQRFEVVGVTTDPDRSVLAFRGPTGERAAAYPSEAVVWPGVADSAIDVEGELVFVGYGVSAPEYDWDDFGDVDLSGTVLLALVGDPPSGPAEPDLFGGLALTYYGRWTYKLEEAARRGAAGVLLVHSTMQAGYPWSVVEASWTGEQYALPPRPDGAPVTPLQGWVTRDLTRELLADAGLDLADLSARAAVRDFSPVRTGMTVRGTLHASTRALETANVVGVLPGEDPSVRNEAVLLTTHYDHLGVGAAVDGDSIYNGAYDNASGVALLLEMAEAFGSLEPRPRRSVVLIATAAEEAGLLGAEYYVRNAPIPLRATLADINIDGGNLWGETDDVVAMGSDRSTLGMLVRERAREMGMRLAPDRAPEKGFFFRSDHFPFVRAGVPALYIEHGLSYRGRPAGWGERRLAAYDGRDYHQPSDEYDPLMDLSGAVQQARLAFLVGYDVAEGDAFPEWFESSEFKPARDRALGR
ncbi:MAG: M20/M25/M40 family metallo-hydrolase [Gemmatimonadota bacterium]